MSTKYIQTLINSNLYPEPKIYKLVVQNSVFGIRHHTNTMSYSFYMLRRAHSINFFHRKKKKPADSVLNKYY